MKFVAARRIVEVVVEYYYRVNLAKKRVNISCSDLRPNVNRCEIETPIGKSNRRVIPHE